MKKTLQQHLYELARVYRNDKHNEHTYDTQVLWLIEQYNETPDWIDYWEGLKERTKS